MAHCSKEVLMIALRRKKQTGPHLLLAAILLCCAFLLPSRALRAQAPAPSGATGAKALTVERIYGQPSLNGEILRGRAWSPDGKLLAYLGSDAQTGEQEIWVVDASTGRRRALIDAQHLRQILLPPASRGQQTGLGRITPPRYLWAP
jgi:hypothetical protein